MKRLRQLWRQMLVYLKTYFILLFQYTYTVYLFYIKLLNIDHRRWSKRCPTLEGPTFEKKSKSKFETKTLSLSYPKEQRGKDGRRNLVRAKNLVSSNEVIGQKSKTILGYNGYIHFNEVYLPLH